MKKHIIKLLEKILNLLEKQKDLQCGENRCMEFICNNLFTEGAKSKIYFRAPTSKEITAYKYYDLENSKSKIKQLSTDDPASVEAVYNLMMEDKVFPFAEKVIYKIEGYGKDATLEDVKKHWAEHLLHVCEGAYEQNSMYKKKALK